jgi:4-amino-4-deoxy-L-arabinose transferase-like glycosyltransferase
MKLLRYPVPILAGAFLLIYLAVAATRIAHPFELEWMEGGSLEQVRRVLDGRPLYAPPSLEFTSFIYPPLYFWAGAAAARVAGLSLATLRALSLLASLASFGLLYRFARRETGSRLAGLLAAGLFAACFKIGGAWFDVARVDSLSLALWLGAAYLLRFGSTMTSQVASGALVVLSFLTKQSALVAAAPLALHAVLFKPRRGLPFVGTAAGLGAAAVLLLERESGGWFRYYVLDLPRSHALVPAMIGGFWRVDVFAGIGPAFVAGMAFLAYDLFRGDRERASLLGLAAAGAMGSAWLSRMHLGGWPNVLMPLHAAVALLGGVAVYAIAGKTPAKRPPAAPWLVGAMALAMLVQLALLSYDPRPFVPTGADREAGRALVGSMAKIPGEVLVPNHPYLAVLAGKPSFAHDNAIADVLRGIRGDARSGLEREIVTAIRAHRFAAVVVDEEANFLAGYLERFYVPAERVFLRPDVFWTVTGARMRPEWRLVPAPNDRPASR